MECGSVFSNGCLVMYSQDCLLCKIGFYYVSNGGYGKLGVCLMPLVLALNMVFNDTFVNLMAYW